MENIEQEYALDEEYLNRHFEDSFDAYMRELRQISFIESENELHLLIKNAQKSDIAARNRVMESFLPLVVCVVRENSFRTYLPKKDLVAEGNFGLLSAIERFKPNKWMTFESYAYKLIKQTIITAIPLLEREIVVPRHTAKDIQEYERTLHFLRSILPHEPSHEEIEAVVSFGKERSENARLFRKHSVSIYAGEDSDESCFFETYPDQRSNALGLLEQLEELRFIDKMLRKALRICETESDRFVIYERFGIYEITAGNETLLHFSLDKLTARTLREVGFMCGLSHAGVKLREEAFCNKVEDISKWERIRRNRIGTYS
jgi:RNA polymerase nonessential primary-like sigma factor